jgi:energy-converting hydrogenase A subunit F
LKIGAFWNKLASPKRIPKIFALILGFFLIIGFLVPMSLNVDQLYPKPAPQEQILKGDSIAPYNRGGVPLVSPGIVIAQYPENLKELGMITGFMTPISYYAQKISPFFGTTIYSSPGGLCDEVLYATRGFDTILESSILMMSFIIASWLAINFTMNRKKEDEELNKKEKG